MQAREGVKKCFRAMLFELNLKRVSRRGPRGDVESRAQQRVWSCQILQWQLGRIRKQSQRDRGLVTEGHEQPHRQMREVMFRERRSNAHDFKSDSPKFKSQVCNFHTE